MTDLQKAQIKTLNLLVSKTIEAQITEGNRMVEQIEEQNRENKQLKAILTGIIEMASVSEQRKAEIVQLKQSCKAHAELTRQRLDRLQKIEAENKQLKEVLKPFAKFSTLVDITRNETTITLQDFMKAKQAPKG